MKVSLITACFNVKDTIRKTLDSILSQCISASDELEYFVVDGGSKDGTLDVIREYEKRFAGRMRVVSEPDEGMYDAINKGIRASTGDIVGILNADDYFDGSDALSSVLAAFDGETDIVYADVRFVRGESEETTRYYNSGRWRRWMHNWGFMPAHPTVYARRSVFDRFGLYKLGYDISADFEWMVRVLCRQNLRLRYMPRSLVVMRLGGKSTSGLKAMWRLNAENVRANRENGYFCIMPMMLPKYFFKIWGYVFRRRSDSITCGLGDSDATGRGGCPQPPARGRGWCGRLRTSAPTFDERMKKTE